MKDSHDLAEMAEGALRHRRGEQRLARLDYRIHLVGGVDPAAFGIGVIGAGRIAQTRQIPAYLNAGLRVVAIADLNPEALTLGRRLWGIEQTFADYRDLLARPEVRIVDALTTTFPRKQIILDAIAAGKHVISEKPFARSYADAREMVEAAERAGVLLAVHQPTRQYYPFALARALITGGLVGELYFIEIYQHGAQDRDYFGSPVTRWHASIDDHLHVEWGAHHFDLLRFLSGQEPTLVHCTGTRMPGQNFKSLMACAYSVEFAGALRASILNNQVIQSSTADTGDFRCRIEGTKGTIIATDLARDLALFSTVDGGLSARWEWRPEESVTGLEGSIGGHGAHLVDLVNAICERRPPISSGRDNLRTVACCLAAKRSAEQARAVSPAEIVAEG